MDGFEAVRVAVVAGGPQDAVVGRWPGVLCVAQCADPVVLGRLLDVCAAAAGPAPGRVLARRLAGWLGGPDGPGEELRFGTLATTSTPGPALAAGASGSPDGSGSGGPVPGPQWAVFLAGAVELVVPESDLALSGADAAAWTDRLLPAPGGPVALALVGAAVPPDVVGGVHDLRSGVVPGSGVVIVPTPQAAELPAVSPLVAEPVPVGPGVDHPAPERPGSPPAHPAAEPAPPQVQVEPGAERHPRDDERARAADVVDRMARAWPPADDLPAPRPGWADQEPPLADLFTPSSFPPARPRLGSGAHWLEPMPQALDGPEEAVPGDRATGADGADVDGPGAAGAAAEHGGDPPGAAPGPPGRTGADALPAGGAAARTDAGASLFDEPPREPTWPWSSHEVGPLEPTEPDPTARGADHPWPDRPDESPAEADRHHGRRSESSRPDARPLGSSRRDAPRAAPRHLDPTGPDTTRLSTTNSDTTRLTATSPGSAGRDAARPDALPADPARTGNAHPDPAQLDTARPDTTSPDTARPDTASPDTARPDTTQADTTQADTTHADTTRLDATRSDTAHPDPAHPDTTPLDAAHPDAARLDPARPDPARPDPARPDAAHQDTARPDAADPDSDGPDAAHPESAHPDTTRLDTTRLSTAHVVEAHPGPARADSGVAEPASAARAHRAAAHRTGADPDADPDADLDAAADADADADADLGLDPDADFDAADPDAARAGFDPDPRPDPQPGTDGATPPTEPVHPVGTTPADATTARGPGEAPRPERPWNAEPGGQPSGGRPDVWAYLARDGRFSGPRPTPHSRSGSAGGPPEQRRPRHGRDADGEPEELGVDEEASGAAAGATPVPVPAPAPEVEKLVEATVRTSPITSPVPRRTAGGTAPSRPHTNGGSPGGAVLDPPRVKGHLCSRGHLNDPRLSACAQCGDPLKERGALLVAGKRPPLGQLAFDDGATHTVDVDYLVGRMPEADARVQSGELQPIALEDRSGAVSRVHAEIRVHGWDVMLVDSGSSNGTFVADPGEQAWTVLPAHQSRRLVPGARVRLGDRMFVFEAPPAAP